MFEEIGHADANSHFYISSSFLFFLPLNTTTVARIRHGIPDDQTPQITIEPQWPTCSYYNYLFLKVGEDY